ncbi:pyrimidine 5'-nucleotidase [Pseudooceanicola nanhaiensis]|jgi:putative hydrolase of the HAD superfamily|uniref:Pyrimidine 5'-nucleotidase n=1 Tax=Pseudooceanicola nanhaiensis TaxID=375761 RepID=A0A917SRX2_9RHOB|nr:pyrimidine 5'-nucleotidase [Pseudooceanicola nanhaiensis]GGL91934.1 pyrimidine 5'-nucleotidase [Pseudooceanicola nanhaiensis]
MTNAPLAIDLVPLFSHVTTWVFDLDNTLYPPEARLFDQIEVRMTDFVMEALGVGQEEANRLRHEYWRDHGTTLAGLMRLHGVEPGPYLDRVHEIDLTHLERDAALAEGIRALPGRKIVYTNGCAPYAERVVAARGLEGLFDAIYGVEHANFQPKPDRAAYDIVFGLDGLTPGAAAMFEDDARNLAAPHEMGLRTVHVAPEAAPAEHIHHHTDDLGAFLRRIV